MGKSLTKEARKGTGIVKIIGWAFFLIGAGLCYFFFIHIGQKMYLSRLWPPQTCTVISSEVGYHPGDGDSGPTYSIDISYSYSAAGRTYTSDRYQIMDASSSGRASKQAVVEQYPPGKEFSCYVNPRDPTDAVISPGFNLAILIGLFPLVFLVVGSLLVFVSRKGKEKRVEAKTRFSSSLQKTQKDLIPSASRLQKLLLTFFSALIWNGIVGAILTLMIRDWLSEGGSAVPLLFMSIFVLVGLLLIVGVIHCLLALENPLVLLTIERFPICLGDTVRISWRIEGDASRLESLSFELEGKEQASYRRDKSTYTDSNVFCQQILKEVKQGMQIERGEISLSIPSDTMHSFSAGSNVIKWTLKVKGSIPKWPDISDDYALDIQPFPVSSGAAPWR